MTNEAYENIDPLQKNIIQIAPCYNWPEEEAAKVYLDAMKDVVPLNTLF